MRCARRALRADLGRDVFLAARRSNRGTRAAIPSSADKISVKDISAPPEF
jgi:hypothetical protein